MLNLDATVQAAAKDHATVTSTGDSLAGVIGRSRDHLADQSRRPSGAGVRGLAGRGQRFLEGPGRLLLHVRAHQTKGWGLHEHKDDRYTLISGEVLTVLYDARLDSATHGLVQRVTLTPQGTRQLLIPPGVWHLNINLAETESLLINHPTRVYEHGKPDRLLLPWDTEAIPFDANAEFANQLRAH